MVNINIIRKQAEYGKLRIVVDGKSMFPTYKPGDTVIVKGEKRPFQVGDIVLFCNNEKFVIHRIIALEGEFVITKGDNNKYIDCPPVRCENIIGIVDQDNVRHTVQRKKRQICINVWKKEMLPYYQEAAKAFHVDVVHAPNKIFEDGSNVCISRAATRVLHNMDNMDLIDKIYFHVGVNISNIDGYGCTKDEKFEQVVRVGAYSLEERVDLRECAFITLSNICDAMFY